MKSGEGIGRDWGSTGGGVLSPGVGGDKGGGSGGGGGGVLYVVVVWASWYIKVHVYGSGRF